MQSNSWVINGNHTDNGLPLLANDPHLGTTIPSAQQLQVLVWDDNYVSGASWPGVPQILIGRNKDFAFGVTSPLVDSTDLWEEEVNDDMSQYFVDD